MIVVQQLGFRAGTRLLLDDVSLAVAAGEVAALAGANGAGKSLLLSVCAAVVAASTGTVTVGGDEVARGAAGQRRLGYLPDTVGVYPHLTVREDLHFFARAAGLHRRAAVAAADQALERWSLNGHAEVAAGTLSRGLLRRLGLARATVHAPAALLLDDPSCHLDADGHERLWRELRAQASAGTAVLLASHDPLDLARADRVVTLDGGRVRSDAAAPGAATRTGLAELAR